MKNQLIIFSKNRACQLDLLLESIDTNNFHILFDKTSILYKTDNENYKKGYEILKSDWLYPNYVEEVSFKTDLLKLIDDEYEFTTFLVDDAVFYNKNNEEKENILSTIINDTCCFSLRLGKNCTYSHPANLHYKIGEFTDIKDDIIKFNWKKQQVGDLSYPLSTDGHIFKTKLLKELLLNTQFNNPNTLEANIQMHLPNPNLGNNIVCFNKSKLISVPINLVNTTYNNRHGLKYGMKAEDLNNNYIDGNIIDYNQLDFSDINGPHKELEYKFTKFGE